MRSHKASSWTRNVPTERSQPASATPKRKSTSATRRRTRRYTVSDQQSKYAQTQGTATRGPIAKAMYHYTDQHGQVWAKWNADDPWQYCGRVAASYR